MKLQSMAEHQRRLANVALTRAQLGLLVVGNMQAAPCGIAARFIAVLLLLLLSQRLVPAFLHCLL